MDLSSHINRLFPGTALTLGAEKGPRLIESFGLFGKIDSSDRMRLRHLRLCHS